MHANIENVMLMVLVGAEVEIVITSITVKKILNNICLIVNLDTRYIIQYRMTNNFYLIGWQQ